MRKREDKELKPSGVEWLGEIPASWELTKIKSVFEQRNEKVSDKDYAALSVTKNGVLPQLENVAKTDNGDARKLVLKGDFVINSRSDRKSSSGVSPLDGSVSLINIVMHNRYDNVWMPFAHHMFKSHMFCEEFYARGNGMVADLWSTNWNKMRFIDIALPPLDEQQRIASFLDAETSKIDSLSDELTKFKANLQLQKRSLVSECVTKGIPSERDRAYKDSGVEWLGEIPAGWEVNKINRMVKFFTGATPPTGDVDSYDGDKLWANISDVGSHYLYETSKTISEAAARKANIIESPVDSLLFSFKLSLGKVSIVKEPMYTNEAIATFLKNDSIIINWAYYAFPIYIPENSKINIYGSPLLNADLIKSAKIAIPPLDEQQRIADYLDAETARIDALIGEIDNQVNLLKTYRKSLINEVVTGKVEV